jgi:hypothetical protein
MGHYNPAFLEIATSSAEELLKDKGFNNDAKLLYDKYFKSMLRAYYVAYQHMHDERYLNQNTLESIKLEYYNANRTSSVPDGYLGREFWSISKPMKAQGYDPYESHTAMAFWLRRDIDGTYKYFLKLLELTFEHLDPQFIKKNSFAGAWTNGEESVGFNEYSNGAMQFSGGGLHEGGMGFGIKINDDNTMQSVSGINGWSPFADESYKVELFEFEEHRSILFRGADNSLKAWFRKMKPSENLYSLFVLNKTKHQLAGKYKRADNGEFIYFYPDRLEAKGLSSEQSYKFAQDDFEFPIDIIYFPNGLSLAYKKTVLGVNLYTAAKNSYGYWNNTGMLVASLIKNETLTPDGTMQLPGRYPFASTETLTLDILPYYTKAELRIMRNEIFARHGYKFNSAGMQNHFGDERWYEGTSSDVSHKLTPLEKLNIEIIQFLEKEIVETKSDPTDINEAPQPILEVEDENEYIIYPTGLMGLKIGGPIDKKSVSIVADLLETGEGSFLVYRILGDNSEEVGFIYPDPNDENKIGDIEVTNPKFKTEKGVGIGATIEELKELYQNVEIHGSEIEGRTSATAGGLSFLLNVNFWTYEIEESEIEPTTKIIGISPAGYSLKQLQNTDTDNSGGTLSELLQGKWQSVDDNSSYIMFEGNLFKEQYGIEATGDGEPFVLANACKNELDKNNGISGDKENFVSLVESDMCYYIIDIAKDYLSLSYMGRGNTLNYRRIK